MSQMTRDINKITGTVISISGKLIIYAVVILLLVEGVTRGYAFGHSVFYSVPMESGAGTEKIIDISEGLSAYETAKLLKRRGLVANDLAVYIQMKFYDYEVHPGTYTLSTAMTSKEILQILNEKPAEDSGSDDGEPEELVPEGETEAGIQINSRGSDGRPV